MNSIKTNYRKALIDKALLVVCLDNAVNRLIDLRQRNCNDCIGNFSFCRETWTCYAKHSCRKSITKALRKTTILDRKVDAIDLEISILKEKLIRRYKVKRVASMNKKARKNNPLGSWIHIFNETVYNWTEYINDFSKIQGEVCVSKESDYQFAYRNQFIGVKIEGKLTAQWNYDCWSRVLPTGKRWGTKNGGNHRNEGWLVPADCKITAIVCAKPNKQITRIARELNLDLEILDQNKRNDW